MTKGEAAELQATWTQQGDPPLCVHLIDLERSEDGYMTGNYPCLGCVGFLLTPFADRGLNQQAHRFVPSPVGFSLADQANADNNWRINAGPNRSFDRRRGL
jgi:hypothetical protein